MVGKKFTIGLSIVLVCAAFAIVIKIGMDRQERVQAAIKKQEAVLEKAEIEEKKKHELEVAALAPNGSPRSYIDDITYHNAKYDNQPFRLATIGSSVAFGAGASDANKTGWFALLVNDLRKVNGYTSISFLNKGNGGFTTGALINEGKVDELVEWKPDMVLFEISVLNDHGQSVPLKETLKNIETIVNQIHNSLPETKVVLVSPNPKVKQGKNEQGLTLADYVNNVKKLADEKDWDFIDVYDAFVTQNINLGEYLTDGVHPNDKGYEVWFKTIRPEFDIKK